MSVLKEPLSVLSANSRMFVTTASLNSKMPQLLLLILSDRVIFVYIAETVTKVKRRCFFIITAEAKRIEAVLKAMLKFVFAKVAEV